MGIVVNGATDIGASIAKAGAGAGQGAKCPLKMVNKPSVDNLTSNACQGLDFGSMNCPLLKESKAGV
jgi:hypothetical protein